MNKLGPVCTSGRVLTVENGGLRFSELRMRRLGELPTINGLDERDLWPSHCYT